MTQMKNKEQIYFVMFKLTRQMNRIKTSRKNKESREKERRKCHNEDRMVAGILEARQSRQAKDECTAENGGMKNEMPSKKININHSRKTSEQIKSL